MSLPPGEFRCSEGITTKPWVGLLVPPFWSESFPFVAVFSSAHQVGGSALPTLRWERLSFPPPGPACLCGGLPAGGRASSAEKQSQMGGGAGCRDTAAERSGSPLSGEPPTRMKAGLVGFVLRCFGQQRPPPVELLHSCLRRPPVISANRGVAPPMSVIPGEGFVGVRTISEPEKLGGGRQALPAGHPSLQRLLAVQTSFPSPDFGGQVAGGQT